MSTGIVFVLIAVRAHVARIASADDPSGLANSELLVRSWLNSDDPRAPVRSGNTRSMQVDTTTAEEYRMDKLPGGKGDGEGGRKSEYESDERSEV